MNFKEAYKGFNGATPDGNLPKINAADDPSNGQHGKDGTYEIEIVESEAFKSEDTASLGLKVVCTVLDCDNGRFKPGVPAAIILHGLTDSKDWMRKLAYGNAKALLAPALESAYGVEVTPYDETVGEDSWEDILSQCSVGTLTNDPPSTVLAGARLKVSVVTDVSKGRRNGGVPRKFARCHYVALPGANANAAE